MVELSTLDGKQYYLSLEEYLKGVVAAEMPASFELEALRAQAVAARTYALRKLQGSGDNVIEISSDYNIDQAWLSKEEFLSKGGTLADWLKIAEAVDSTQGIFLSHQGQVALTAYHSASGYLTDSAAQVWGEELPYLRMVKSPYEEESPYNSYRQSYSVAEFSEKIGISLNELNEQKISILERSESGRVLKIQIADQTMTGRELRESLGLRSANFEYRLSAQEIEFITKGYGHGVGMSQYGANGMAKRGYSYLDILAHYYPGVDINKITN
ncbi:stage II sporulation protein D [Fuchsiella alkaliacetigena]|uniref:stage II sporulation protein D n=1 Tax=Fuchsiella alkaliacetigena TaxID=957042 RepID=UPI00200B4455|nr:stage II sporulation protein D [Fuchsiella alkaliacetigena]MCK8824577.1 stage II sporulation protein D [Fuchsiella alkaliacetigena]